MSDACDAIRYWINNMVKKENKVRTLKFNFKDKDSIIKSGFSKEKADNLVANKKCRGTCNGCAWENVACLEDNKGFWMSSCTSIEDITNKEITMTRNEALHKMIDGEKILHARWGGAFYFDHEDWKIKLVDDGRIMKTSIAYPDGYTIYEEPKDRFEVKGSEHIYDNESKKELSLKEVQELLNK